MCIYVLHNPASSNLKWQSRLSRGHSLSAMQLVQSLQIPHILLQGWVLIKIIQHVTTQSLEGNVNFHFMLSSPHTQSPPFFGGASHFLPSWTVWRARLPSGNLCTEPSTVSPGAGLFVSSPEPPSCPLSLGAAWCNRWDWVKAFQHRQRARSICRYQMQCTVMRE